MNINPQQFIMAYEDTGEGVPILFVHAFPLNRQMWLDQVAGLSSVARVITTDLRGFGDSHAPAGTYDMDLLAEDCYNLLSHAGINGPVVICGLSMGGYVAFAFYRRYPQHVSGLILAATRAGADTPEGRVNRDRMIALAREKGASPILSEMLEKLMSPHTYTTNPALVQRVANIMESTSVEGIIGASQGMKNRQDHFGWLNQITIPVLVMHGLDDQLISYQEAEKMSRAMNTSKLVLFPEAGHMINLEQPELFNGSILRFLGENHLL
jgi:3-oxoadipate enol-lactonase